VDEKSPKRDIGETARPGNLNPASFTSYLLPTYPCTSRTALRSLPRISDQHAKVAFFNRTACQHRTRKQTISAHYCYSLLSLPLHALISLPATIASPVVNQSTHRKDGPHGSCHPCCSSSSGSFACQCWSLFEEFSSHSS
jgi:hypothetical protein